MNKRFRYRFFVVFILVVLLVSWQTGYSAPPDRGPYQVGGAAYYGPITFSTDLDETGHTPVGAGVHFAADTLTLYASLSYSNVAVGTLYEGIWYLDGEAITAQTSTFTLREGILENHVGTADGLPLPTGTFQFALEVEGVQVAVATCTVGDIPGLLTTSGPALPAFGPLQVTAAFDEANGVPGPTDTSFPYGTTVLYFFASYSDAAPGTPLVASAYYNGQYRTSWERILKVSSGMWWERITNGDNSPLPAGEYVMSFEVDGEVVAEARCTISPGAWGGGKPTAQPTAAPALIHSLQPTFSPITFCADVTDDGVPVHPATMFPAGTTGVWAYFTYANMRDGMVWGDYWEENGEFFTQDVGRTWEDGAEGWLALHVTNEPLPLQGEYTLTLFVAGDRMQEASFFVESSGEAPAPTAAPLPVVTQAVAPIPSPSTGDGAPYIGPITFCETVTADGQPVNASEHFAAGTRAVAALFTYRNMSDGLPWGQVWTRDGQPYAQSEDGWAGGPAGWEAYYIEADADGDLSGTFTLTLFVEGVAVRQGSFQVEAESAPPPRQDVNGPHLGSIIFCEDVTDDGRPVNPTNAFREGTDAVWAYFTYDNMQPEQSWGRFWTLNGEPYVNASYERWDDDVTGWVAYSISDPNGLEAGEYALTLYIDDTPVQQATVQVAEYTRPPQGYFGAITFATGMTDDREPIGTSRAFDFGVDRVYAIFDYFDMSPEQLWSAEWVIDGATTRNTGAALWGEGPPDGTTYLYFEAPEDQVMLPGEYGINLYLDGELNQSASFAVLEKPTPEPPSRPEEIIDPDLLPAWHRLASCPHPTIQELAQVTLKYHIPISFKDMSGSNAQYIYSGDACNTEPGQVVVSVEAWNELSWEEVASKIGHELWHATQLLEGGYSCDCTVQKEVEAKIVELYVLRCLGREDILTTKWAGLWEWDGEYGTFDKATLWRALEEAYPECELYEP